MEELAEVEQLWREHAPQIRAFVRRKVGSDPVADDVTSDVFVAVANAVRKDPTMTVGVGLLYTVAKRRVVDLWRHEERQGRLVERCGDATRLDFGRFEEPGAGLLDLAWLECVPVRQRTAIALRYIEGMSVGETAERMGVSYQGAESLLARGRSAARTAVENNAVLV